MINQQQDRAMLQEKQMLKYIYYSVKNELYASGTTLFG